MVISNELSQDIVQQAVELATLEGAMRQMMGSLHEDLDQENGLQAKVPALKRVTTQVVKINESLQASFEEQSKKIVQAKRESKEGELKTSWWLKENVLRVAKWANYGIGTLNTVSAGTEIYYASENNCPSAFAPLILNLITMIASGIFGLGLKRITEEEEKVREQVHAQHHKEMEARFEKHSKTLEVKMFRTFLRALTRFEKKKEEKSLKKCIVRFNELPKNYKNKLPGQDRLISSLIRALPDDNKLKGVVKELYRLATDEPLSPISSMGAQQPSSTTAVKEEEKQHRRARSGSADRDFTQALRLSSLKQETAPTEDERRQLYGNKWIELETRLGYSVGFLSLERNGIQLQRDLAQNDLKVKDVAIHINEETKKQEGEVPPEIAAPTPLIKPPSRRKPNSRNVVLHILPEELEEESKT